MDKLSIGDSSPTFSYKNEQGTLINIGGPLKKNNYLVIYFYPKDFTGGCTKEACSIRDGYSKLKDKGIEILGISPDDSESHSKFKEKYKLPFELVPDTNNEIAKTFGVYGEKRIFGLKKQGIIRTTFIINKESKIVSIIKKVNIKSHAKQILNEINDISSKKKSDFIVTANTRIDEAVEKIPNALMIFMGYGLSCAGCYGASIETIEQGAKSHGFDDETINMIVRDINSLI